MTASKLPTGLLKTGAKLFDDAVAQEEFLSCFSRPPNREQALIWLKEDPVDPNPIFDFQPPWVTRASDDFDRGRHDSGDFYVLDASSVFAASPVLQLATPEIIFDACAAPGGKSVFSWRALKPKLSIANEFVEKRLKPLISNLQRCQIRPSEAFHLGTRRVGEMFPQSFPLVLVDAPCSGQSLLLKGERVDGAFHAQTVNGNAMRQRRILAELALAVAPQGHMLYMTCTFSEEENEDVIKWFTKKFPQFVAVKVPHLEKYQSHLSDFSSYRLWPQQNKGAGSFCALLKNTEEGSPARLPDYKPVWRLD